MRNDVPRRTPMAMNPTTCGMPSRWNALPPRKATVMIRPMMNRISGSW
jgi:hypothetical protein